MHITSLPTPYGIGTMGKDAYAFVDFLVRAGQRYWQILPLTPTGYGDSPIGLWAPARATIISSIWTGWQTRTAEKEEIQDIPWGQQSGAGGFLEPCTLIG